MLTINQANLDDIHQVTHLFEQYRLFYNKAPDPQGAHKFIEDRLSNHDSVILLALYNSQAAGFIQLYPTFSSTAMQKMWLLNDLFVDPQYRRHSIGLALMNSAKAHAIDNQAHSLKLCTSIDNHQAQALYLQLGYKKVTAFDHYSLLL
jgi:ribosomal protein S18 acetylase RimI-like enzyme